MLGEDVKKIKAISCQLQANYSFTVQIITTSEYPQSHCVRQQLLLTADFMILV